ncbi:Apple-like [Macleaya cordata]|uniref:Apple-like n=1 Tax=Macleaya cordata TaxID=56857 RepID=A0A200QXK1_MACCD|nr:Apple-like [Macleaya cordata]
MSIDTHSVGIDTPSHQFRKVTIFTPKWCFQGYKYLSFDSPSDTLLNGQGIRPGGANNKLVSRLSNVDDSPGPYSLVINREGETNIEGLWVQPKYNSTLSLLRLGWDGNLHVYTYYEKGYWNDAWDETFTYFNGDSECQLPEKCGSLGICAKNQCVACPTPQGLSVWSEDCKPPKLPPCSTTAENNKVSYYKIEGVNHFLSSVNEGEGPMKMNECEKKCSKDCKCVAFFYRNDTSKCLLTNQLNTLAKVSDSSSKDRVAFIKYAK